MIVINAAGVINYPINCDIILFLKQFFTKCALRGFKLLTASPTRHVSDWHSASQGLKVAKKNNQTKKTQTLRSDDSTTAKDTKKLEASLTVQSLIEHFNDVCS